MFRISGVDPEFDISKIMSNLLITPKSPCIPSLGCKKIAGVPVLDRVAAILFAICPDLPTPIKITFPFVSLILLQREYKFSSKDFLREFSAATSIPIISLASCITSFFCNFDICLS